MASKRNRRMGQWASEAARQALIRYGPEISGLNELMRQATSDYHQGLAQARGNAQGTISTIDQAIPGVRDIYENAGLTQAKAASTFEGDAGKLAPGSPLAAAAALEQSVGVRHLNEAQASALTDLQTQRTAARSGQTFASSKARQDFLSSVGQILARRQDLAREEGAFTTSTAQQLMQASLDRQQQLDIANARLTQSDRNSLRSAGIDPDTGQAIKNGPLDPNSPRYKGRGRGGKDGRASQTQIGSAQDATQEAVGWARRLQQTGLSRADVAAALSGGRDATDVPLHDPATGKPLFNPDGTPKTKRRGGIPKAKSQLLLSAALDQVFNGYVSDEARRKLHRRGIYLTDLGLMNARDYRRRHQRPPLAPGANGQSRPT